SRNPSRSPRSRSGPCRAWAGRWRRAPTLFFFLQRLEGVLGAAALGRMLRLVRRGAHARLLVPPDGAPLPLRFLFLRMLLEVLAHELGQVGFIHVSVAPVG